MLEKQQWRVFTELCQAIPTETGLSESLSYEAQNSIGQVQQERYHRNERGTVALRDVNKYFQTQILEKHPEEKLAPSSGANTWMPSLQCKRNPVSEMKHFK